MDSGQQNFQEEDLEVQCSYSIQTSHKTATKDNDFTIQLHLSLDNQILL